MNTTTIWDGHQHDAFIFPKRNFFSLLWGKFLALFFEYRDFIPALKLYKFAKGHHAVYKTYCPLSLEYGDDAIDEIPYNANKRLGFRHVVTREEHKKRKKWMKSNGVLLRRMAKVGKAAMHAGQALRAMTKAMTITSKFRYGGVVPGSASLDQVPCLINPHEMHEVIIDGRVKDGRLNQAIIESIMNRKEEIFFDLAQEGADHTVKTRILVEPKGAYAIHSMQAICLKCGLPWDGNHCDHE